MAGKSVRTITGMAEPNVENDTIAATATAPGQSGVAVIRISGPDSISILGKIFRSVSKAPAEDFPDRKLVRGTVVKYVDDIPALRNKEPEPLDDCLAVVMRAPRSFTGEHVAEMHIHGGWTTQIAVLDSICDAGARPAYPGEFSKRAFLNGKMDLAQAEALSDLIAARTKLSHRIALRQLRGGLSARVETMRSTLIDAAALLEAHIDFPDEDIPALKVRQVSSDLAEVRKECAWLVSSAKRGILVREGARVVLAGKPNAGKSSLFNALIGRERAIVTPHPGTTRDTIEATVEIDGVAVTLVDTAGLRETSDVIEQFGVEKTNEELRGADVIIHVIDATELTDAAEVVSNPKSLFETVQAAYRPIGSEIIPTIIAWNKSDLVQKADEDQLKTGVRVSASRRLGLRELEEAISEILLGDSIEDEIYIVRVRHAECLKEAVEAVDRAMAALTDGLTPDLVMVDIREALIQLGEITGERLDEQILDRIFSTFCLGK